MGDFLMVGRDCTDPPAGRAGCSMRFQYRRLAYVRQQTDGERGVP